MRQHYLKSFFYKALNRICRTDITQVLYLDKRTFVRPEFETNIICRFAEKSDLERLATTKTFGISDNVIHDFEQFGFLAIVATINGDVVGLLFLASGTIPARHNSGGAVFKGIAVSTPDGCFYLFKVDVLAKFRGRRVNPAMITYAIDSLESRGLTSVVTTTDWTNQAFSKSAERLGFVRRGHASEFVLAGVHRYQLPKPLDPNSGKASGFAKESGIIFYEEK